MIGDLASVCPEGYLLGWYRYLPAVIFPCCPKRSSQNCNCLFAISAWAFLSDRPEAGPVHCLTLIEAICIRACPFFQAKHALSGEVVLCAQEQNCICGW